MSGMSPVVSYACAFAGLVAVTMGAALQPVPSRRRLVATMVAAGTVVAVAALLRPLGAGGSIAVGLVLLAGGSTIGSALGARVAHGGYLLPVAVVSALADAASVLHPAGPSATVAEDAEVMALLALPAPVPELGWVPILGVGDVVFTALYVAAARRHGLGVARTLGALALGYAATLIAVVQLDRALPALPFLGGALVLVVPEARAIPPAERRTAWSVMLGSVVAALALLAR
jgi:hypothetical protein